METTVKTKKRVKKATEDVDVRHQIKPRGLCGMFKGKFLSNGTDEEVFGLTLTTNVG